MCQQCDGPGAGDRTPACCVGGCLLIAGPFLSCAAGSALPCILVKHVTRSPCASHVQQTLSSWHPCTCCFRVGALNCILHIRNQNTRQNITHWTFTSACESCYNKWGNCQEADPKSWRPRLINGNQQSIRSSQMQVTKSNRLMALTTAYWMLLIHVRTAAGEGQTFLPPQALSFFATVACIRRCRQAPDSSRQRGGS